MTVLALPSSLGRPRGVVGKDAYNAKGMPAKTMGGFRLVAGVTDQHFDPLAFGCLDECIGELDVVGLWASIDEG